MTDEELLNSYKHLAKFLAEIIGDNAEVALHDVRNLNATLIAIHNNHVSGREVGAPLTDFALNVIKTGIYKEQPYITNYKGASKENSPLRSSTYFIKNRKGKLIGLLCINIDIRSYLHIVEMFSKMAYIAAENNEPAADTASENFPSSVKDVIGMTVCEVTGSKDMPPERFTIDEKFLIIKKLYEKNFFMFKGAISEISEIMKVSEASVYRYLAKVKK